MAENKGYEPTLADVALVGKVASKGLGMIGEYTQYRGLASIKDLNAGLAEITAESIVADSEFAARRMEERGDKFVASQIAKYAKSGVTFSGSPMKVVLETEKNIRLDIMMSRYNAIRQANQQRFRAMNLRLEAGAARNRANFAISKGILDMYSTVLLAKAG